MKRTFRLAGAVLLLSLAFSCTSLSEDDQFLLRSIDDQGKAKVLTEAGIEEYTLHLVQRGEYEQIPAVRAYFDAALRYDPANATALRYLRLVDDYRSTRLATNVREADRLLAKKSRTEDETWTLCVAVQRAIRLDPADEDARRLERETVDLRITLLQALMAREQSLVVKITDMTPEDTRDRLWADAYVAATRALAVDPENGTTQAEQSRTRAAVAEAGSRRLRTIRTLIDQGKFSAARAEIVELSDLNQRSGGALEQQVRDATYDLNYRWASWHFGQKEYASADVKVDAALAARRTSEAAALKRRITEARTQAESLVSFDAGLQEVDRLVADSELVAAWRRIDGLARSTKERGKLDQLEQRRGKIRSFLDDLYAQGLEAYRRESFAEAIEALAAVVQIDEGYEQAADYLEKARSKQKLIEQF